ncbi:MAG: bifunctional UDP-N-acetylglucosamine diphosphorylase/glucosamine-1-phosphate N-acetyltransferase GlmU [Thermoleophilaceae bacterium]|nr:bifunctional UDP-N-acetylglucosamine diphosphorylase/glucosamine-1-phosphate N-acetyltransferase GlmU [Thermoleophilaceae bacterium]
MPERFTVLLMAAGRGTRMRSSLPKVLHPVCGRPMVEWVIEAARAAGAGEVVCITRPGDGVADGLPDTVTVAEQREGEGTGAAILAARGQAPEGGTTVVLSGDHPLVSKQLIEGLVETHETADAAATLLTTEELDPAGYGRIVRADDGSVDRIVETKHTDGLSDEELAIREINIGAYAFEAADLWPALEGVGEERGELYLTGVLPVLRESGRPVAAHVTTDVRSAMGVNNRADLMDVEEVAQRQILESHAHAGVTFLNPSSTRVEAGVEIGEETTVEAGVTLRGTTRVGAGCVLGPATTITDSTLGDGVTALHAYLVEAEVDDRATLGPFAYLRPGARIGAGAKIGTFVEVKNSSIGADTKIPHLSYIGDADVGENSNIGAGNITANYDGKNKHRTTIGRGVKTSVDTSFVAPVSVGDEAYTGAGSVITEDVPDGALGIARSKQQNVEGYAQRKKDERPA